MKRTTIIIRSLFTLAGFLVIGMFLEFHPLHGAVISTATTIVTPSKDRPITTLRDLNQAFIDIAKAVMPTVVTVSTEKTLNVREMNPFSDLDPFGSLFGNPFGDNDQRGGLGQERKYRQEGLGSGVIVSSDGYILTNNHVVQGADSITVRTYEGQTYPARVIGSDPKTDIAVIRVNATGLPAIQRGNSDNLQVGEMVIAVGSPLSPNLAHTVTQGIVSAKGRANIGLAEYEDFIQTDAAINPGNSGGALVNMDGELVGINSAIVSQSGGFQGIGLAVPINMALQIMNDLIKNGKVVRGWLGVAVQDLTDGIAKAMHLTNQEGALIGEVVPESPASKAGVEAGDLILKLNGRIVENSTQLRNDVASMAPGTEVSLSILRAGKPIELTVKLGELPVEQTPSAMGQQLADILGFKVETASRSLAQKYGFDPKLPGVVVTDIDQNGNAYDAGLREGDLIRSVDRENVSSIADFNKILKDAKQGDTVLLQIIRQNGGFFLAFTL